MPVSYQIIRSAQLIIFTFTGKIDEKDIINDRKRIAVDPDFNPKFSQILDFRAVTEINLSYAVINLLAQATIFNAGVKKVLIAPTDLSYGFARMYQSLSDNLNQQVQVFRRADQALEWLGLSDREINL